MTKKVIFAASLFLILTTITFQQKLTIPKFYLKKIIIENNNLIKDENIKKLLRDLYNKNLLLINNAEIKNALIKNSLIESFNLKKKYPDILRIEIYEKKPIAILLKNKNKFYLSDKIDLIEFKNFKSEKQLPYVLGDEKIFKNFYEELKRINFPFNIAKKYTLYESNRWDIETINNKVIKLPSQNFIYSLQNYLEIKDKINFQKYKLFDYRIKNQLILK